MFDKLIDLLAQFWDRLLPFEIIDQYAEGVVLTLGRLRPRERKWEFWKRKSTHLGPGFHWIWPFFEKVLSDVVVPTTFNLQPQSLTTADGQCVVVSMVITRSISDIEKSLLEVENPDNALVDSSCGAVAKAVRQTTWDDLHRPEFEQLVLEEIRKRAKEYGIRIHRAQLSDISKARSIRIWQDVR